MRKTLSLAFVVFAATCGCVVAPPDGPLLWQLDGGDNTVYLLGSVHLLRAEDYPLPLAFEQAYVESERLVMELDMDDLDAAEIRHTMLGAGLAGGADDLSTLLGEQLWAQASAEAAAIGVDLESLRFAEPWLAALTIIDMQLYKVGYDPRHGIEVYFSDRARRDAKPVDGLETVAEQIAFFDELPLPTQQRLLLKAIEDAQNVEPGMDRLVTAWRTGDTAALEQEMLASFDDFPELYEALVVSRNRRWARALQALLDDEDDYLVVVGALHLIGQDSVVALLRDAGHRVRRH